MNGTRFFAPILITLVLFPPTLARAATIHVPADQPTIQIALDVATAGDEVVVAPDTYREELVFPDLDVTLRSSGGPGTTTLSGEGVGTGPAFQPYAMTYNFAENRFLVTDRWAAMIVSVDGATGDRTDASSDTTGAGPSFVRPEAIAYEPLSSRAAVWDVTLDALFLVQLVTGDRSILADATTGGGNPLGHTDDLEFDLDDNRVLALDVSVNPALVVAIDLATGGRTTLSGDGVGMGPDLSSQTSKEFAIDSIGDLLYVATNVNSETALLEVDLNTGDRVVVSSPSVGSGIDFGSPFTSSGKHVTYDPLSGRLAVRNGASLIEVDLGTGDRTEYVNLATGPGGPKGVSQLADPVVDFTGGRGLAASGQNQIIFQAEAGTNQRSVISNVPRNPIVQRSGNASTSVVEGFTIAGSKRWSAVQVTNGAMTIRDCELRDNTPTGVGFGQGGALYVSSANVIMEDCVVSNSAQNIGNGGAVGINSSTVVLRSCLFAENSGSSNGALFLQSGSLLAENSVFVGNDGGVSVLQVWNTSADAELRNCALVNNGGSQWLIFANWGADVRLTSSIARANDDPSVASPVVASYTNLEGGIAGTGNIDVDPLFLDADGPDDIPGTADDDFHLTAGSPCVGVGDPDSTGLATTDFDGTPRIVACRVDMGPFESAELGPDCNTNGVADACELAEGTSLDLDGNTVPDECEGFLAYNVTQNVSYASISDALAAANPGDEIQAPASSFTLDPTLDLETIPVHLVSLNDLTQPGDGSYTLGDGSSLRARMNRDVTVNGTLTARFGAEISLDGQTFVAGDSSTVTFEPAAEIHVDAADGIQNSGVLDSYGAAIEAAGGALNAETGTWSMYGDLLGDFENDGQAVILADAQVVGDYLNDATGTTTIQNGTLTVLGTLTNLGTLVGDAGAAKALPAHSKTAKATGHTLAVLGHHAAGQTASFLAPGGAMAIRWAGNVDLAIDDAMRLDLVDATVNMVALEGAIQQFEVMSRDIGADPAGLDRNAAGHFPIGTLRVGPSPTTVSLVDARDNDLQGQGSCEALYVQNLIVDTEATLNTNQCRVYYEELTLLGSVDDPNNLIDVNEPTAVEAPSAAPTRTRMLQNQPNPFNPYTTIRFDLDRGAHVVLAIFDITGRRVRTLQDGVLPPARHELVWDGKDDQGRPVASGVYLYRVKAGGFDRTLRMMLLR